MLAAFFGGVIVDRLGFRTTSIVADLASAAAVAAIPLLDSTVGIELWQLMALVFLGALLDAPGATARQALFPDVVELAGVRMERASGIRGAIQNGRCSSARRSAEYSLPPSVRRTRSGSTPRASSSPPLSSSAAIPRARREVDAEPGGRFFAELAEGMRFIWSHRLIRAIVLTVLITNLLDAPLPVVCRGARPRDIRGREPTSASCTASSAAAALVGALAYSGFGHRLPRRLTFVCCFSVVPLMYLALATEPPFPAALVALAIVGLAAGPINPLLFTVASEVVPTRLRGRVFGATRAGAWASIPLGILLGGVVVETLGVAATFLVIGLCYLAVTAYGFFNPAFREMDRQPESAAGPTRVDGADPEAG